jgi:tetratricopeptide (TPR) repeat protein
MSEKTPWDERLFAGVQALQSGDFGEVINQLTPVADQAAAAGRADVEVTARGALAQALMLAGRYPEALEHATRGLERARAEGLDEAIPQLEQLRHMAAEEPPEARRVTALNARIQELIPGVERGEGEALVGLRAVAAEAVSHKLPGPEATARGLLGQALLHQGRREEAEPELYRALALAEEVGSEEAAAHFRSLLTGVPGDDGMADEDLSEDEQRLQQAVEFAHDGRPGEALSLIQTTIDRAVLSGSEGLEASARGLMAQILLNIGQADQALENAERALALAEAGGAAEAAEHFRELVEVARLQADPEASAPALNRQIHDLVMALQGGELEAAVAGLEAVVESAVADEQPGPEATARGVLAQVMMRQGRTGEALIHARRALTLAEEGGAEEAAMQLRALVTHIEGQPVGEA